ncbi:MAG: hypothetical protein RLZZ337_461 [Bacteroidota bacterium]
MIYLIAIASIFISYLVGRNAKNTGHGFWRSFIFMLLLCAIVLAFIAKQLNGIL